MSKARSIALTVTHVRRMRSIKRMMITELLVAIGFSKKEVYYRGWLNGKWDKRGPFWARHADDLDLVLAKVHERYKHAMKRWHPDVPGGNELKAKELNLIWDRVRKLCERRMG